MCISRGRGGLSDSKQVGEHVLVEVTFPDSKSIDGTVLVEVADLVEKACTTVLVEVGFLIPSHPLELFWLMSSL